MNQVLRVRKSLPCRDTCRFQLSQCIADDLGPALIEYRLACLNIPFPSAHLRAYYDVFQFLFRISQPRLALPQFLLCLLQFCHIIHRRDQQTVCRHLRDFSREHPYKRPAVFRS